MSDSTSSRPELPEVTAEEHSAPSATRTSRLALVSLVMAIGGSILFFVLFFRGLAVSIPILLGALVTGHIAIRQIKRTGERGGRIAVTGLFIGYACAALLILAFGVPLLFLGMWRTDAP